MTDSDRQTRDEGELAALRGAIEQRRKDPELMARLRRVIDEDRELLERLAK